jgi:hypothetical protein
VEASKQDDRLSPERGVNQGLISPTCLKGTVTIQVPFQSHLHTLYNENAHDDMVEEPLAYRENFESWKFWRHIATS